MIETKTEVRIQLGRGGNDPNDPKALEWHLTILDYRSKIQIADLRLTSRAIADLLSTRECAAEGKLFMPAEVGLYAHHRRVTVKLDEAIGSEPFDHRGAAWDEWAERVRWAAVTVAGGDEKARLITRTNVHHRIGDEIEVMIDSYRDYPMPPVVETSSPVLRRPRKRRTR